MTMLHAVLCKQHREAQTVHAGCAAGFRSGPFSGVNGAFGVESGEDRVVLDLQGRINTARVRRDWLVTVR